MERHTFTVNFWASPSKARKTGLMPIYVTIRMNGERATFTTGKYIHPNDWDEVKQRARGTSDSAQAINNHLLQLRNKIYNKVESIQKKTLCQVFEEYIVDAKKSIGIEVTKDTVYSYERTFDLLEEHSCKTPPLPYEGG